MGTQERMCGLCLNICDNFKAVEGDMKNVLNIVLPKMNSATVQELMMCTNCTVRLMKCFDFKAACFYAHDYLVQLVNGKDDVKVDLKDVYLMKNENNASVLEDQDICGFCMNPVKYCSAMSLDGEKGVLTLKEMIEQCLPELDLSIIKKPVICPSCHGSLENCFRFVTNYLIAEKKIKKHCRTLDINSKSQIELGSLLEFATRVVTIKEVDGHSIDTIKIEEQLCEETENGDQKKIGNDGNIFKLEQVSFEEENMVEIEEQKFLVNQEIEIKTEEEDFNRFEYAVDIPPEVTTRLYVRLERLMPNFDGHQLKPCIKNKSTKYKQGLRSPHRRQRKSCSEVTMYKCYSCSYQTKHKHCLKLHVLSHKDPSEVIMFSCTSCSYRTKYKGSLNKHALVHKDPSEVIMYSCDYCSYQTKHRNNHKSHILLHKDFSEVIMYKCSSCSFQTRHKGVLKSHTLLHRDPSEVKMHKCKFCSYQTKRKGDLAVHEVIHKGPSEVIMYGCDSCPYQSRHKNSHRRHKLVHKDPSEVIMYKCGSCLFQTKWKNDLGIHAEIHKGPSNVVMYDCDSCSYQTRCKRYYKRHELVHKNPSEVAMYKCDACSYQTKRKYDLKSHALVHMDPSKVMYRCASCSYQTKAKSSLRKHVLVHKDPEEVTTNVTYSLSIK